MKQHLQDYVPSAFLKCSGDMFLHTGNVKHKIQDYFVKILIFVRSTHTKPSLSFKIKIKYIQILRLNNE